MTGETTTPVADEQSFASSSVPRHLARGVVGFGALIGAVAFVPVAVGSGGWWFGAAGVVGGLALAGLGLFALRGCPTCWAIGLAQTISKGRLRRTCVDGRCGLTVAGHD
ncbi:hypothetical protein [Pseudonocardia spinosispora]|uniref:hypothetical protein n=1 Tax=Pseudonocardia spinosispora TaxID=103441 RepID=UPI00055CC33E|nr:hypothetical protein [Pseudonocardia spinosispora]